MPKRLNANFVSAVKAEQRTRTYGDGRGGYGLTLAVRPNGVKHWYQRLRIGGRPTNIGLGGYPLVSLSEARSAALANARVARSGGDPRRRRVGIPTVAQTVEVVLERDAPTWRVLGPIPPSRGDGRNGRSVSYLYDQNGQLQTVRDVAGNDWEYDYGEGGLLLAATGPNGKTVLRARYNEDGKVVESQTGPTFFFNYISAEDDSDGRRWPNSNV
ncbi:MAG: integrase arm-type DNA-binding domain-containing protein [Gammaproteobacteria bacterium]|nr:integrase arm-type DNA-binding domain-containing protein [Gammaproteobacteria bacterium]